MRILFVTNMYPSPERPAFGTFVLHQAEELRKLGHGVDVLGRGPVADFHPAVAALRKRLRQAHGHAVLWDAHSIASVLPRFFEGRLTDLNLGTVDGRSCAPSTAP